MERRQLLELGAAGLVSLWLPACRGKSGGPVERDPGPTSSVRMKIHARGTTDGDGATLARIFPSPQLRNFDPFVLLDDFDVRAPAGFPTHPHLGFEAFTYMIEGAFEHRDTLGNVSKITSGGTQRFNSGRGAKHSEMPASAGSNRGLQLWVNLPRKLKRMEPEYTGHQGEALPVLEASAERTRVISGGDSPVALHTEVDYRDVTLLADRWTATIPADRNTLLYAIEGTLTVGAHTARRGEALLLESGALVVGGERGSRFAYLSGRPHGEPIVHRGPYVD